jgi:hypothetical protein
VTPVVIQEAFAFQSKACADLGSPFMGQLMRACATMDWPAGTVRDRIFAWEGDISPRGQSVPLRLAGALHALHLQRHDTLSDVYPPRTVDDATLWGAVSATLISDEAAINTWLDSPPQTNEVRRAATLIAVGHWLTQSYGGQIHTAELGASGGLNLHWDAYGLEIAGQHFGARAPTLTLRPDWTGPLPPDAQPIVADRAGVDLNPLDPSRDADALRLQAYLWPDQPHRLTLTRAAISSARTQVAKGDAVDWLSTRMPPLPGTLHLIYSTVAWQYFPQEKQDAGTALIETAGAMATQDTPLAWFGMENDGGAKGAALTVRLWPGNETITLGRADFHGRWVDWTAP